MFPMKEECTPEDVEALKRIREQIFDAASSVLLLPLNSYQGPDVERIGKTLALLIRASKRHGIEPIEPPEK